MDNRNRSRQIRIMPLDPTFVDDAPYDPDGLMIDEIVEVSRRDSRVSARLPVSADMPITRSQRVHPVRHPVHVAAGIMVHLTGIMGYVHAYHFHGLRHREGWTGYGVRIHGARFLNVASVEEPLLLSATETSYRKVGWRIFSRYLFVFQQGEKTVYDSEQSALWFHPERIAESPSSSRA
ncbi:MAG TPA: hypothetical protein RMG48_22050 [Myxococcales bacterium LLY-WYZ-16_1]|nr:hypothetical protein [Myxococcales bacterium LLY-WYZ-16_1]